MLTSSLFFFVVGALLGGLAGLRLALVRAMNSAGLSRLSRLLTVRRSSHSLFRVSKAALSIQPFPARLWRTTFSPESRSQDRAHRPTEYPSARARRQGPLVLATAQESANV